MDTNKGFKTTSSVVKPSYSPFSFVSFHFRYVTFAFLSNPFLLLYLRHYCSFVKEVEQQQAIREFLLCVVLILEWSMSLKQEAGTKC